jgi:hypothetical protein
LFHSRPSSTMGKKMKAIFLLLLFLVGGSGLAATPSEKWKALVSHIVINPSSEVPEGIQEIINGLDVSGTRINLKGFEAAQIEELKKRIPQDYLIYSLGHNPLIFDAFSYTVIKEIGSESFWVLKKGGYPGVFKLYRKKPIQTELSTPKA